VESNGLNFASMVCGKPLGFAYYIKKGRFFAAVLLGKEGLAITPLNTLPEL